MRLRSDMTHKEAFENLESRIRVLERSIKQLVCKHCFCQPCKYTPEAYAPMDDTFQCCHCWAIKSAVARQNRTD